MGKRIPAYAEKGAPVAMALAGAGEKCEHCGGILDVLDLHYHGGRHNVCRPCSRLFGAGTRWEYVGGGMVREIRRTP